MMWEWKFRWIREWFEWELNQINGFREEISHYGPSTQEQDTWEWKGEQTKIFTVKSAYNIIQNNTNGKHIEFFKTIWKLKVIPSALHFVWRVGLNCVATKDNLVKR